MHETMLLLDAAPVRQMNLGVTVLDDRQRRADQRHRVLQREAGADAFGEMGVGNMAHGVIVFTLTLTSTTIGGIFHRDSRRTSSCWHCCSNRVISASIA